MNWIGFTKLIYSIYGPGMPDLEYIQKLGLLAIKLGQVHALRIDFLSREKCQQLAKLYRQTFSLPSENFLELLKQKGSKNIIDNFSNIEKKPLASASIGQIHKAKLKNGKDVVIKAIKGNYKETFKEDVNNLEGLFKIIMFFYPKLKKVANPLGILEDIKTYTLSELDLTNEIKGRAKLKSIYEQLKGSIDLSKLDFFNVYKELSNDDVLVSEYINGQTFDELLEQGKLPYDLLLDLFLVHGTYMFVAGTFHGDIHPGNVIYSNNKLYFVDTGSVSTVTDKIRKGLFHFFKALSNDDFKSSAGALQSMSEKELTRADYSRFEQKFFGLYRDFKNKTVSQISLTQKMMETIKLGVHSGMEFGQDMFPIIRSLMYMDGMVLKCKSDAVLLKDMRPFIDSFEKLI
ncbi:MAG: AarF/ABC1/UbiB kinase family protein [Endomicrobiales bacterium]|nr:AarF/ABC1/UbiB kinase family protein [Endomicrobiales bacterium]